ncbi:MAG: UDP-glucose/GDP-mannose dehydrogenase family protein [Gammaproteobacteria bacterium]|nr:UDP-glucose/GDP-mannose dehydrogenase family protein [Gammaproteobacteria bacterium]MBV9727610.1 UDP-glucose/GDP-mannose dehydrogenase family protein [Gammaproteobacteria bacterium]
MQIAVFGLGYVGVVSAACLARDGHSVVGVDPNSLKVDLLRQGKSPIVEPELEELIVAAVASGRLVAGSDAAAAVNQCELLLVCVGTPGQPNGSLDLSYVRRVVQQIGTALAGASGYKVIVIRSTLLPGSMQSVVIPALEESSGRRAGTDFGVCINPEFLREGSAIYDFDHPPKTVIGACDERAAATVRELYARLSAPLIVTDLRTAEMVKYVDNSWHALKVTFANEVGRLCKAMGVDARLAMRLFCMDTKLNISSAYLRPGFAFGGSCLPKDVRALTYQGRLLDVDTPVLSSILASNQLHIAHALAMIRATGRRRVGLLGLSFKEGTDDLRESPVVTLAEQLIGKGYELAVYDRNVRLASLMGANREYILNHIPHIGRLMVDRAEQLLEHAEVVVVASAEGEVRALLEKLPAEKSIIDLVGMRSAGEGVGESRQTYAGIAW